MRPLLLIPLLAALATGANGQHMGAASPRFAAGFNQGSYDRSFFSSLLLSCLALQLHRGRAALPAPRQARAINRAEAR